MDAVKKLKINNREYTVNMMPPMAVLEFFHNLMAATQRGDSKAPFIKAAITHCLDPMMRSLDKTENFEQCFAEHPDDMFPLGNAALDALIAPFLPSPDATKPTAKP
jgi:hypothetical protein